MTRTTKTRSNTMSRRKQESIYVSLPLDAARDVRTMLLKKAAAAAEIAATDPTLSEVARADVTSIYYTVEEIDRKVKDAEKEEDE